MIPWWVLKPACDLVEAVINRVSPIQGAQVEAHRRTAAFHALEVFEEEHEVFPGEQDGLDELLSWPPQDSVERREAVGQYTTPETYVCGGERCTCAAFPKGCAADDGSCYGCGRLFTHTKDCPGDPPVSAASAGADPSPALSPQAGDNSPEGVIPPTPSGPPTVKRGLGEGLPFIQGYCPACGWRGLFVGSGGYITCSQIDCPDPGAVTDLLAKRPTNGTVAG